MEFVMRSCWERGAYQGLFLGVSEPLVTSSGGGRYSSLGITQRQHRTTWKMERGRRAGDGPP